MDEKSLSAVNKQFNQRKKNRDILLAARREEVYRMSPRIREIDDAIFSGGLSMLSAVWEGNESPEQVAGGYAAKTEKYAAEKRKLLKEAGFPSDYLEVPYTCPHCKDTGMHGDKLCGCYLSLMSEVLFEQSGMGKLLKKQKFETFDLGFYDDMPYEGRPLSPKKNMQLNLKICMDFVRDFGEKADNLFLYGNPGLGKTFLSSAIANALLERGVSVLYQTAGQITDILSDARFGRGESETAAFLKDQLVKADLLIIDDLGTEFINAMTDADMFYIVNSRILSEKSTIISTNLSLEDIKRVYSERMLSRIMGHYQTLCFYGKDIRSMR